jgi:hypothetical protein
MRLKLQEIERGQNAEEKFKIAEHESAKLRN